MPQWCATTPRPTQGRFPLRIDRIPDNARASGQDARTAANRERIAEAVEEELERLRKLKPGLESRIDRASGILLLQLASPPRTRPVRVRIHGGEARFLVSS